MQPTVSVRNLRKRYGQVEAARGVSFDVEPGEIFGLLGPNGAGKTTTVECVIGLREPDEGEIEICGIDARRELRAVKQKIGAALQSTQLQDRITPREALGLFGSLYQTRSGPGELLKRFSLAEISDKPFESLSGGQRQRLAMALAFVNQPEVVFLDEPSAGLDPLSRREIHGEIARMKEEGRTVLLTTHYLEEAEELCDRVAIIDHGRIIASGRPAELVGRSAAAPVIFLSTSRPVAATLLGDQADVEVVSHAGGNLLFRTEDPRKALAALMPRLSDSGIDIIELSVRKATLEDVFVELTGSKGQV